ncbi:MAG: hydroxysqualene dehydroxylase HpnE [Alphaproteobacteria bacterium]
MVHIIGCGLSGLSCAVRLAEAQIPIALYDQAGHAGGRCRSYHDTELDRLIDNGNHLILSGNDDVRDYLERINAQNTLIVSKTASYSFVDLEANHRWVVHINSGRFPTWIFNKSMRVPNTKVIDYLSSFWRVITSNAEDTFAQRLDLSNNLIKMFWEPLAIAALNTEPATAAINLLKPVLKETFLRGGQYCKPMIAGVAGLSGSFINPALSFLAKKDIPVHLNCRLRSITQENGYISNLEFTDRTVDVGIQDTVVLAVTAQVAGGLLPNLIVPQSFRSIVNGHFRIHSDDLKHIALSDQPPIIGVFGGTAEWLFIRDDVISTTTSAAERLVDMAADDIATLLWSDIQRVFNFQRDLKETAWRVVKEKRATFAQTPQEVRRRPKTRPDVAHNLYLAGDWIDTGLPATIEGSLRSGRWAAEAITQGLQQKLSSA